MITRGMVVDLAYSLKDSAGEVLDQSGPDQPLSYLHGYSQIVVGLETALEGLKAGDKKSVTVSPEQGYGQFDLSLKISVPKTEFPKDARFQEGMQFVGQTPQGQEVVFTVEALQGDNVLLNGNHPLAGQTLHFDVEIVNVRQATEEELTHGHAHGPDGHH